ncbi:site-specific integrase [Candidatus Sulfurimonas marisnigri]|uniref:Site-specific integrase n=1 Tax=Candidatus Sulfurimonas marisnigri TaxID=2740405 RepID=A0A7S7LYX1_9BACT|nr:site-specific integrase [Candidatus Sulfurimonas marisnigri]QOY54002.1 site-specific integrase [Candidatus Sulfurimonas marisnigri]
MSRIKSKKYSGVYLNKLEDGDISYSVMYKDEDNKTKRFTIGKKSNGITETYAYNKRNEFVNKIKLGEEPTAVTNKKKKDIITLDSVAVESYEQKEKHNRNNQKSKRKYEIHVSPTLGKRDIRSITSADVEKLQTLKLKSFSPKMVNTILGELSTVFNYGIDKEIIALNPIKKVKSLKVDNTRERYLNKDEISLLLKRTKEDEQIHIFTLLALTTGARANAIASLTPRDINFDTKIINILDEKNNERYTAFLANDELESLLRNRTLGKKVFALILEDNNPNVYNQISYKMASLLDTLFNKGITETKHRVVIHSLRHTFASHLAINGTPIFTIQKLLNHKDINMTLRYAKLAPDSGRESVQGLLL